jgi:hypothetical protein
MNYTCAILSPLEESNKLLNLREDDDTSRILRYYLSKTYSMRQVRTPISTLHITMVQFIYGKKIRVSVEPIYICGIQNSCLMIQI